jgi:hypothetical protein
MDLVLFNFHNVHDSNNSIQFNIENEITIKVDKFTLFLSMLCCENG